MSSFQAEKYNEATDPHKPKVNDNFQGMGIIKKVQPIELGELLKMNGEPDKEGFKDILIVDNPERPFLKYLIWID